MRQNATLLGIMLVLRQCFLGQIISLTKFQIKALQPLYLHFISQSKNFKTLGKTSLILVTLNNHR